ncbi:hypothetical protein FRB94_011271 [Tulasnella sp. JGI-2019a]|nr:hypothetical protein FRB94_011271 [Tulasnella sp. JGI-2019a]
MRVHQIFLSLILFGQSHWALPTKGTRLERKTSHKELPESINHPVKFADVRLPTWPNSNDDLDRSVPENEGASYASPIPAIRASSSGLGGANTLPPEDRDQDNYRQKSPLAPEKYNLDGRDPSRAQQSATPDINEKSAAPSRDTELERIVELFRPRKMYEGWPRALTAEQKDAIWYLNRRVPKLSQRNIAKLLGVGNSTVQGVMKARKKAMHEAATSEVEL